MSFCVKQLDFEKSTLYQILAKNIPLNIYQIGDLDSSFYEKTKWFALYCDNSIVQISMLYIDGDLPVLFMLEFSENQREFVKGILSFLPDRVYLHVHPKIAIFFEEEYSVVHKGIHKKMYLTEKQNQVFDSSVTQITNQEKASEFYRLSYPDNFFNPESLKTGAYLGIVEANEILAIAGVHVYSEEYGVAALGNITTRPDKRRMGLGEKVTEALITHLSSKVKHIGLNVDQDNVSARSIYESLGFVYVGTYLEAMCTRKM